VEATHQEPLITANILAKRLGEKRSVVYWWVRSGIPHYRFGIVSLRFKWSEVVEWLESRRARLQAESASGDAANLLEHA
jgi:excisionase family DNA binding protein